VSFASATNLLEAIVAFNKVKNGDSGDAEYDAGVELQDAALAHLRAEADESASTEKQNQINSFGDTLDNDVEDDEEVTS
jgi:hypothetical protein